MWQTDFTQFLAQDWSWYYLSTVMDDYSRYILAYWLSPTMTATDAEETSKLALGKVQIERVKVYHRPRMLSDNGSAYHSKALASFLTRWQMDHIHSTPYHPTTQGKVNAGTVRWRI